MRFSVTILGCNSALPTSERNPTAQVLNVSERFFLVDCGEGTQMQLRKNKIRFTRISHVFISHLHGDHCFGLPGLLSTLGLLGRTADLHIYGPSDTEKVFGPILAFFCRDMKYKVCFHSVDTDKSELVYEDKRVEVFSIPLTHRIPACGYLFREKEAERHIIRESLDFYNIPVKWIPLIKKGLDYVSEDGTVIPNSVLTKPSAKARSYAFCSDTKYSEAIIPVIKDVDLLYHEATFLSDNEGLADMTFHSTARQAAEIAKKAGVKKLILGHYSTRYKNTDLFRKEAAEDFQESYLAEDGMTFDIPYSGRDSEF